MMPRTIVVFLLFAMCFVPASAQQSSERCGSQETCFGEELGGKSGSTLTASEVWSPLIEELEWSEVRPSSLDKPWLALRVDSQSKNAESESDQVVVLGIANTELAASNVAAAKHIMPALERRLRLEAPWDRHFAMRRIVQELSDPESPIIVDSASQTFFRSVEDEQIAAFTREALLLDLSDENLQELRGDVRYAVRQNHRVLTRTATVVLFALAATIVVCWVGSRFLDRLTQGYYVWQIRLATSVVLLCSLALNARFAILVLKSLG